ncbi:serine/threonine-protein kinase [Streptomyces sp. NPDC001260]|uniref:Serine/threonine-protein kinase n=1 Tax=Streptomyces gilvifuscus TaxID=1550617 RepID=A0ABT5FUT3_9ACTN|nr:MULTISPECIES: serine/threonine-protein kinase [Streptomyces]MBK3644407.1 serine/threonine protein kinase [Streptomyces sp. MBT33]MDC2956215.1 serine/threonine-protein kinase [Streptomyces gilvifuscus]
MNMAMMRLRREDPRVVGSFRLHRRLGAGGMGVVYLGSDKKGQRVALKVIRPDLAEDQEFRSRFAREVSAARRIRGGCTARLVAADLDADRPWFATQYVPGPSLHDKVADEGPLAAADVAAVGAALSEGLVAVHEAGVVHRDLKPSNILLSPKGPRIIDFGIAWATGASTLTHVGTAVGSPGFLAPEQVRGAAVTPATDVFALGATLAYASMADSPFGHGSSEVMLYRVVHEEPQLHGVPDALAPLVRACLAKDPEERPSTLQLSLRLKEIAAREAQGLAEVRPPGPRTGEADRPTGRLADTYPETLREPQRRRPQGTPPPRGTSSSSRGAAPSQGGNPSRGGGSATGGSQSRGGGPSSRGGASSSRAGGASSSRSGSRSTPASRNGTRSGGGSRPGPRSGAGRPGPRTTGTGRRPANPRLLRQRLFVFVVVTLLVALGIAAAKGCQGPPRGLGGDGHVVRQHQQQVEPGRSQGS